MQSTSGGKLPYYRCWLFTTDHTADCRDQLSEHPIAIDILHKKCEKVKRKIWLIFGGGFVKLRRHDTKRRLSVSRDRDEFSSEPAGSPHLRLPRTGLHDSLQHNGEGAGHGEG